MIKSTETITAGDRYFALADARYGTVCHQILLRATRCHRSVENLKHCYFDCHISLFCFLVFFMFLMFLDVPIS